MTVTYPGGQQEVALDRDGRGELRPAPASRACRSFVDRTSEGGNIDSGGGGAAPLGAGVTELRDRAALPPSRSPWMPSRSTSGAGRARSSSLDGRRYPHGSGRLRLAIHLGRPVEARGMRADERLDLEAGVRRIELGATAAFSPSSVLAQEPSIATDDARRLARRSACPEAGKTYRTPGAGETLVLRHNDNPGLDTHEAGGAPFGRRCRAAVAAGLPRFPATSPEVTTQLRTREHLSSRAWPWGSLHPSWSVASCWYMVVVAVDPRTTFPRRWVGSRWVGAVMSATDSVLAGGLVAGWWGVGPRSRGERSCWHRWWRRREESRVPGGPRAGGGRGYVVYSVRTLGQRGRVGEGDHRLTEC